MSVRGHKDSVRASSVHKKKDLRKFLKDPIANSSYLNTGLIWSTAFYPSDWSHIYGNPKRYLKQKHRDYLLALVLWGSGDTSN